MSEWLHPGEKMPEFDLPRAGGGTVHLGGAGRWQMVVVYRGRHCPICRTYLGRLEALKGALAEQETEVVAVSADSARDAEATVAEWGLSLPVGYAMDEGCMRILGLYVSDPLGRRETDHRFPEPGLFLVNPEGKLQILDISNSPSARPDLEEVVRGIAYIRENRYPVRGTAR